jgi:GT2 family glycosyltransferase
MITIVYSTHKDEEYNNKFRKHLLQTVDLKDIQIIEYVNHNEFSLSEIYNRGIKESIHDIVVCVHNDVKLEKSWGKKLLDDFNKNPEFGIIGKAGSCYFPESGVYWEKMQQTMVGQVYHEPEGKKKWLSKYSPKFDFLIPVVTIDGLFISFDKTKIKHRFDESIGKFHFYDHFFCVPNYLDNVKIGVTTSFEITHKSVGRPNDEFFQSKELFVKKYKDNLPIDLPPQKIFIPQIKEKPIKNIGKVAVIIPTKGNIDMLFKCLDSYYEHCNESLFDIIIADTGSSDEEKNKILEHINQKSNIKLVEYDYYNFAKINNDVVKNHLDDSYEFILFSNNDIVLLNNVIYGMLNIFKSKPKIGTVGARLHFEDNKVQHDGIIMYFTKDKALRITHIGLKSYFNYSVNGNEVLGNTAALLMIRKKVFEKCGMFNETYQTCFEDVELNLQCLIKGYTNYCDGSLVAYHFESQTRNQDETKLQKEYKDYFETLTPFIEKNVDKLFKHIKVIN